MERKYVTVIAEVKPDGDLYPKTLRFEDGSEFKIDRRPGAIRPKTEPPIGVFTASSKDVK